MVVADLNSLRPFPAPETVGQGRLCLLPSGPQGPSPVPGTELMPMPAARTGIKSSSAGCLTWGQSALGVWPLASLPGRVSVAARPPL